MYNTPPSVPVLPQEDSDYERWTPEQRQYYQDWWEVMDEYTSQHPEEYPDWEKRQEFIFSQIWKVWSRGMQPPDEF